MAGIRMTGLVSGMDTESMVKELVSASSTKVDKVKQNKQRLEWKKEAWQSLNTKIYDFYKNELAAFKTNTAYKGKKASANDETKVSVSAFSGASDGVHTVSVKQLASSAYLTGANIKNQGKTFTYYGAIGTATDFADMTDADGNSLNLEGKTIEISDGTKTLTYVLGGNGIDGVANLEELNSKLAENEGFKLKAVLKDGIIAFDNTSGTKDKDGEVTGVKYIINGDALGVTGVLDYKNSEEEGRKASLEGNLAASVFNQIGSQDIKKTTFLKDMGIVVGTSFSVNGKEFVVDDKTTLATFAEGISKLGVAAGFDETQGRFYINAKGTGLDNDFNLTSSSADALEILGLGTGAKKIDACDAIIDYNGVEYRGSSNTFNINGLAITAKSVTGEYNPVTGELKNNAPVSINIEADNDQTYETIKKFVKKYNELIDEMNKLYDEEKTTYDPLTDDERSKLSDTQIEKWEEKAKKGLLRRDSTISSLLSSMRNILNSAVEVTNDDGTTTRYTLASLGIVTGNYSENGKLHILGDPDDSEYSSKTNKLKEMLSTKPEVFAQVLGGTKDEPGIGYNLYSSLTQAMSYKENRSSAFTVYDNLTMDEEIDDYDDEIEKWEEKLQKLEDKYYDQFAAMETAMAKLQSQQSYISSLMGGA